MKFEKKRLEKISRYYLNNQLEVDKLLVNFRYQTIKKYFKGNSCLEVGIADGLMTKYLVKDFKKLTILDGSKKLISGIKNYKNLKKINSLLEKFKTNEKFSTIILDHVLEHVKYPNIILRKIYNLLDKNGVFIVGVPNADSLHRLAAVEMSLLKKKTSLNATDYSLGHRRVYTKEKFKKTLIRNNFKIIKFEGSFLKVLSNYQIEQFFDKKIINAYYKLGKKFPENCADICFVCKK